MTAIETSCTHSEPDHINCAAQAGEQCRWPNWNFAQPHPEFHTERIESAAGIGGAGIEPTTEEFDRYAVEVLF